METLLFNIRDEYRPFSQESIKKIQSSISMNCEICLLNIRTCGNIGMLIRQACLMGCKSVIICGRKHYDKRFTVGSHNYIPVNFWETPINVTITCKKGTNPTEYIEKVDYNVNEFVKLCGDRTPIFLEQYGTDIREVPWKCIENQLVIVGNESLGIPKDFIESVKGLIPRTVVVSIPQWSVMRSLNVSNATSIVLWEIRKNTI